MWPSVRAWGGSGAGGPALATLSTMVFAAIVLAQMANAFECRSARMSLRALGPATNRLLVGAVAVEGLALLRLADRQGLRSEREYARVPSLVRGAAPAHFAADAWVAS